MAKNIAVFVLGLSSPVLVHILNIFVGLTKKEDVMSGIINTLPYNALAFAGLVIALIILFWYSKKQAKKTTEKEAKDKTELYENITTIIKEAIKPLSENINILVNEIRQDRNERNKENQ